MLSTGAKTTTPQTCVYCDNSGPFSDEHLFPAGLGGDDTKFLLKNLVCKECNEVRFSKIEASFMRSSPHAFARVLLQDRSRRRGSKVSKPRMDSQMTTVVLEDGTVAEAEIHAKGQPRMLVQFLLHRNGEVEFTGDESGKPQTFVDKVRAILSADRIELVRKIASSKGSTFSIESYAQDESGFLLADKYTGDSPPKDCVWIEPINDKRESSKYASPRLFQKSTGQLVIRVSRDDDIATLLGQASRAARAGVHPDRLIYRDSPNPVVQTSVSINLDHYRRAYAKIAMNFLVYILGEHYARHHAFNRVKNGIVHGSPMVQIGQVDRDTFSQVPSDRHVIAICSAPAKAGRYALMAMIRLYGGLTTTVLLSRNAPKPITSTPLFMTVDYKSHNIEIMGLTQFAGRYKRTDFSEEFKTESAMKFIRTFWPDVLRR